MGAPERKERDHAIGRPMTAEEADAPQSPAGAKDLSVRRAVWGMVVILAFSFPAFIFFSSLAGPPTDAFAPPPPTVVYPGDDECATALRWIRESPRAENAYLAWGSRGFPRLDVLDAMARRRPGSLTPAREGDCRILPETEAEGWAARVFVRSEFASRFQADFIVCGRGEEVYWSLPAPYGSVEECLVALAET